MFSTTQYTVVAIIVFILYRTHRYRRNLQVVERFSQVRTLFKPLGLPGVLFRTSRWHVGVDLHWALRKSFYRDNGSESIAVVPLLVGNPLIYTSNLDVARQVIFGEHKTDFTKPLSASRVLVLWGMNLLGADGEMWRKHRRIVGPAFTNKLYDSVWDVSAKIYHDMVRAEGWSDRKTLDVPIMQTLTFQVALMVIGRCGFGFPFEWRSTSLGFRSDSTMTLNEAFHVVTHHSRYLTFVPKWFKDLRLKRFEPAMQGFDVLTKFMHDSIENRRHSFEDGDNDKISVFDMIMKANKSENDKLALDDSEVIGNVWGLLLAGHETTAQTLAATLGFLSVYNDLQDEVYAQIKEVLSDHSEPVMKDYPRLDKVLHAAVGYPAGRTRSTRCLALFGSAFGADRTVLVRTPPNAKPADFRWMIES